MALVFMRATFARSGAANVGLVRQINPLNASKMAAVSPIQVATMRATYGEPYGYEKPYPYETKHFGLLQEFFDNTKSRLNENSKVITVEGNLAVGKNDFAKRLAADFDLKYIESVPDSTCYISKENGFDMRSLNEILPERCHFYDLEKFLRESDPKRGTVGRLQLLWFMEKFFVYAKALRHLLSTGQGVVVVRSPYSDSVFVDAMRRCGYVTPKFVQYYNDFRANSICELLKPHLTVYLDTSLDVIKQRIKARNNPAEQNSKVLTDEYLMAIDEMYKQRFLPKMRESGAVMEIDWTDVADDMDMDTIAEEIQRLNFESEDVEDTKFKDWYKHSEDTLCNYRKIFGSDWHMESLFMRPIAWDCPEINYSLDDLPIIERVIRQHPAIKYEPGWAPEFGHSTAFKFI